MTHEEFFDNLRDLLGQSDIELAGYIPFNASLVEPKILLDLFRVLVDKLKYISDDRDKWREQSLFMKKSLEDLRPRIEKLEKQKENE